MNMSVKECAKLLGKPEQWVRIGLQRRELPFGCAVQMTGGRWSYHVSRYKVKEYLGVKEEA